MFKIKKRTEKIFSTLCISGLLFLQVFPAIVSAATIPDSFFDSISKNINTAPTGPINSATNDPTGLNNKQQGPKVDVTFTSEGGAQAGTKMTAVAVPSFFNNASDPKELYFTWYLKRSNCDLASSVDGDNANCDLDGDGKIKENDWKIAAARIIVKGNFDRSGADYTKTVDDDLSGYKASPSPIGDWKINSGADENDSDASNCYVQEPKSGLTYEMRRVEPIFNACPDDAVGNHYHSACVSDQLASCDVLNPLYPTPAMQAIIDENAANIGVPGYPKPIPDEVLKTIPNDFSACAVATEDKDDFSCDVTDIKNFKTTQQCSVVGQIPVCVRDNAFTNFPINATDPLAVTNPLLGIIFGKDDLLDSTKKANICSSLAKPNNLTGIFAPPPSFLDNTQPALAAGDVKCSAAVDKLINGTKDGVGNIVIAGNASIQPTCGFKKGANMCKHLFPRVPTGNVTVDGKSLDMSSAVTGDGKFSGAEKQFWGADPTVAATNGISKDEESIVGLGVDKFSWMFSVGDQVGVVVEGDSAFPTSHADSSFKRMWAFSNNVCKKLEDIDKSSNIITGNDNKNKRGFYIEGSGAMSNGFLTAEVDLNDCLEENLLDPAVSSTSNLAVQLNASPANPINDPNGRGDILNIASGATNTTNPAGLLYKWSVQKSRDGSAAPIDTTSWMDVTSLMQSNGSFAEGDVIGLGKKDLAIDLNMPESLITSGMNSGTYDGGAFYLKIKVKITGTLSDGSQNAEGAVIIRVRQQGNEMHVYPVTAADSGILSLNKGVSGQDLELCSDPEGKTRCYVTKNQILGLEVPDINGGNKLSSFSWKVNGNSISCGAAVSSECTVGGSKMFVPVIGNEGEAVDVVAKALTEKGEFVEVSRHFVIGSSIMKITLLDSASFCGQGCLDKSNACPKYLGFYKDLNGGQYPDCSTQVLETNEGRTVTLSATGQTGFDWAIDGQIIPEFKDQNQIQLYIDKSAGESYNIGLSSHLLSGGTKQLSNTRLALYRNWGVSPENVIEENQNTNIQLDVVASSLQSLANSKPTSFGASLITHLPEQLMFLLKISLTSILLLLVTGVLFAFIPETLFKEKE